MTNPFPDAELEQRAATQRQRLHDSVVELRTTVRGRLDVQHVAQTYVWQGSAVAGLIALALGYAVAGAFTD